MIDCDWEKEIGRYFHRGMPMLRFYERSAWQLARSAWRVRVWMLLLLVARVEALEVRESLWGFDGRVVPGAFAPFSVLMENSGERPFDGVMELRELHGMAGGATVQQPVYLSAHSSRWVQFQVFIGRNTVSEFSLSWGRGAKEHTMFDPPLTAGPARVFLRDSANPFVAAAGLKSFPDALFPTTPAATVGLDAVVLDYAPRWEAIRREAFLDWVRAGGTVHLLAGRDGKFPEFTESLAALNFPGDRLRIGAGLVVRHAVSLQEVNEQFLGAQGFPATELKMSKSVIVHDVESTLLQRLASLTRPKIAWWLINSLTLLYIVVVGPVHYRLGRKLDYRLNLALFAATVVLFSWLFAVVGARGYNERQTVHSLTLAHALGGGRHLALQWISAFATNGAEYDLTHSAPANLYGAGSQSDASKGVILNGREGRFLADIPLYSARPFVHAGVMNGDDTSVTVEQWELTDDLRLKALSLLPTPGFPKAAVEIQARYRGAFYPLAMVDSHLRIASAFQNDADYLSEQKVRDANYNQHAGKTPDEQLRDALPLLAVHAAGGAERLVRYLDRPPLPPDQIQLYIFTPSPPGFQMHGKGFANEKGYTLYVQDVFRPNP